MIENIYRIYVPKHVNRDSFLIKANAEIKALCEAAEFCFATTRQMPHYTFDYQMMDDWCDPIIRHVSWSMTIEEYE